MRGETDRSVPERCSLSEHLRCAACGGFIPRNSQHAHNYRDNGRREDLCGDCVKLIYVASYRVLRAAEACGLASGWKNLDNALRMGVIEIWAQAEIPLN